MTDYNILRRIFLSRVTAGVFFGLWAILVAGIITGPILPEIMIILWDLYFKLLIIPGLLLVSTFFPETIADSFPGFIFAISLSYFIIAVVISALVYLGRTRLDIGGPGNDPTHG